MAQSGDDSRTSVIGSLRLDYFSSSRDLDDVRNVFGASLDLQITHRFTDTQRLELDARFSRQLAELLERRADPVEIAADWSGEDLETCLTWLSVWTDELARRRLTGAWSVPPPVSVPESVIEAIPAEWIYWYRDELHGAMRRMDGALNVELTLENLLVPWAGGLEPQEARG